MAHRVVSGEGGSMGRGARPVPGWLPGGLGLAAVVSEVGEKWWGSSALGEVFTDHHRLLLGYLQKQFCRAEQCAERNMGQVAAEIPARGMTEGCPHPSPAAPEQLKPWGHFVVGWVIGTRTREARLTRAVGCICLTCLWKRDKM